LENGSAQISLVVGRASLQHFLQSRTTKILGCAMNSCPYYLVVNPLIAGLHDLSGRMIACREGPARNTPLAETLMEKAQLGSTQDLMLVLLQSDQAVFEGLLTGKYDAALLPRPYGFLVEERGFRRIADWPDVVDDPLPITIETTDKLLETRGDDLAAFLTAHKQGIAYLKNHRAEALRMLQQRFYHSPALAAKSFDDYLICMNEGLSVNFAKFRQLLSQIAPDDLDAARKIAADWVMPGALSE
jgi:ABC-type nitrate/sulfonate/bicarbonate transport system substrate-binding protein